jgi:hypothetical protein
MNTFDRKKKLDRSATVPADLGETDFKGSMGLGSHQQLMASLKEKAPKNKDSGDKDKGSKAKHHRSYSLIPHWKLRDHLMRLPFLKHHQGE